MSDTLRDVAEELVANWSGSKPDRLRLEAALRADAERAARAEPGLDVERLTAALWGMNLEPDAAKLARKIAVEYARLSAAASPDPAQGGGPDPLRDKDRSMAEHSDTRSACPQCGEWRDSPDADCANCGYGPAQGET